MNTLKITKDETKLLEQSLSLDELIIQQGGSIAAPEGKLVLLTVDGVHRNISQGRYIGKIELKLADNLVTPVTGKSGGKNGLAAALVLGKDGLDGENSVTSAYTGGSIESNIIEGGKIASHGDFFNALIINDGQYTIKDLTIEGVGHGDDDFSGHGVGIVAAGNSKVVFDNLKLYNQGILRNALIVGGNAQVTVKNSDIKVLGGTGEQIQEVEKLRPGKAQQSMICGGWGTTRCVNLINSPTVNFENSLIQCENWGVLATDDTSAPKVFGEYTTHMNVKNCVVRICGDHGYGTYAIGATDTVFVDSEIHSPDMAMKIANENAKVTMRNSKAEAGRFVAMFKSNQGGGLHCTDSELYSGRSLFIIPSCYPEIVLENCKIRAGNNTIIQLYDSDDPGMNAKDGKEVDNVEPIKDENHDVTSENRHDIKMFGFDLPNYCTDCKATFKSMDIFGNFYNSITNAQKPMVFGMPGGPGGPGGAPGGAPAGPGGAPGGPGGAPGGPGGPGGAPGGGMPAMDNKTYPQNLILTFDQTSLKGIISSSRSHHAVSKITSDTRQEIYQVYDTPTPAVNNGVIVNLKNGSCWTVWGRSYITALSIDETSSVKTPDGSPVVMTVNGVPTVPEQGKTYKGDILVTVN